MIYVGLREVDRDVLPTLRLEAGHGPSARAPHVKAS